MVYLTTIKHRCVLYVLLVSYILLLILSTVMALSAVKSSSLGRGLLASNPLLHPRHNNAVHLISFRHIQHSHHIHQCQSSSDIQGTEGIVLTPEEENLFQLLKRVVVEKKLKTTVRVAGGWVRDKLLSVPGKDDVDIALDNMTGLNFVAKMNEWIEEHGMDRVRFGVIQQNPDKSKHLETVAMNYGKISIDFVNLRTESYTTSSRIPLMAIGTPQEDAYRRDLTINALFYNIHSNTVEDFTHMGIQDLKQEMIRTPLEPLITLTDDPLRALRAVRFACRFNFNITSELLEACANEEVHQSLLKKVSKERISAELELMMKTPYFARAMYVLYRTQLWQTVMRVPEVIYTKMPLHAQPSPSSVFSTKKGGQFYDHLSPSSIEYQSFQALFHKISTLAVMSGHLLTALDVTQRSPRLSAVLDDTFTEGKKKMFILSLSSISTTNYFTKVSEERRMCHVSESMLQNNLKLSTKDLVAVTNMHMHMKEFIDLLYLAQGQSNNVSIDHEKTLDEANEEELIDIREGGDKKGLISRLKLGLAITEAGVNYPQTILFAAISHVMNKIVRQQRLDDASIELLMRDICHQLHVATNGNRWYPEKTNEARVYSDIYLTYEKEMQKIIGAADTLFQLIEEWQLQNVWADMPLLNGTELTEVIPNLPRGSLLGKMMVVQKKWKLCHPHGTKEELTQFLRGHLKQYL